LPFLHGLESVFILHLSWTRPSEHIDGSLHLVSLCENLVFTFVFMHILYHLLFHIALALAIH
jgi:hypothetical protein